MGNAVLEILKKYLSWEKLKEIKNYKSLSWKYKEKLRIENDEDVKHYINEGVSPEKALYADTIISFWTPYRRLLKIETGCQSCKTSKSLETLIKRIEDNSNNPFREVSKKIETFAQICYTKGNFMLLPNRQMNIQRYRIAEDRIDLTLYECFEKGVLAKFFESDDKVKSWIEQQRLNSVFINRDIRKDNIDWFVKTENRPKLINEMSGEEICDYLSNAVSLIEERNK